MDERESLEIGGAAPSPNAEYDSRKYLALSPRDADLVFSSQSSYGGDLSSDFRENVKALGQVYQAIQRYMTGALRRENVYYPELEDISRELSAYKRSVSDKIPMPSDEQLLKYCLCLAGQEPAFIHVLREPQVTGKMAMQFLTRFVAPTAKHPDKVLVGYRSTLTIALNTLKSFLAAQDFGFDYGVWFAAVQDPADAPVHMGRADGYLRKMLVDERSLSSVTGADVANLKKVNAELNRRLLRPLLTQAARDRLLVVLPCEDIRSSGIPGADKLGDIVLFNHDRELRNRLAALTNFLKPEWLRERIGEDDVRLLQARMKAGEISQLEYFETVSKATLDRLRGASEPPREAPLLAEALKLCGYLKGQEKQNAREAEVREIRDIVKKIQAAGSLFRLRDHRKLGISEENVRLMLRGRVPGVLACTEPFIPPAEIKADLDLAQLENVYLIYRDRRNTAKAIDTAIDHFEKTQDSSLLFTIEDLLGVGRISDQELKEYVAPVYLERLRRAANHALASRLPWWSRMFLFLTSSEISETRAMQLRAEMSVQKRRRIERFVSGRRTEAKKQAQAEVRRTARERVERTSAEVVEAPARGEPLDDAGKRGLDLLKEKIDLAWERGLFPVKDDLQRVAAADESGSVARLIGLIDVGAASVREVARIPVSGGLDIYASREYLKSRREELMHRCESKLRASEGPGPARDELVVRHNARQRDIYEGLLEFLKRMT